MAMSSPNTWLRSSAPLLLAILACLATASHAQEEGGVTLTVRGLSGRALQAKRRRFLAVNVSLDNASNADSSGTLRVFRVRVPNRVTPDQSLFYERRVEVPRQGRRVETLYYYCQEEEPDNQLCVSYEPDDGSLALPVFPQLTVLENKQVVLMLSSRRASADAGGRVLRAARIPGARTTYDTLVENADLRALPDHMAGYEACDFVVAVDLDDADLPPEKARPLLDWVSAGGDLIVTASGGRSEIAPALQSVLPVTVKARSGPTTTRRMLTPLRLMAPGASLPAATPVLIQRAVALPNTEVLASDPATGDPLVVRGRHGAGYVTYLAFPLDAAPLRNWNGARAFASRLLRQPREDLEPTNGVPTLPPIEELVLNLSEALETLEPPSALIVAPLLLLYVALVSPLNFFFLSRIRKLNLAQVSAGVVALAFGGMFFAVGVFYKGSEALVTQIAVVELPTQPGKSRVDVMTGYFSTDRGLSQAETPRGSVVGPIANQSTSREARVVHGPDGLSIESLTTDTWALRRFRTLRVEELGYIELDLALTGVAGRLRGTITNHTQLRLETPVLLVDNGYVRLERINAGAAVDVHHDLRWIGAKPPPLPIAKAIYEDADRRYPGLYGQVISNRATYSGAQERILATLQGRLARVPRAPGKMPALLLARVTSDPGGVVVAENTKVTLSRMLVICEVQVALPAGYHTVRGIHPVVVGSKLYQPNVDRTGSPPQLMGALGNLTPDTPGKVEWRWQLPVLNGRAVALDSLKVRWRTSPRPVPLFQRLEGYSYRSRRWITLQDMGKCDLDSSLNGRWPEEDINPMVHDLVDKATGTVRFRMINNGQNVVIERIQLEARFKN